MMNEPAGGAQLGGVQADHIYRVLSMSHRLHHYNETLQIRCVVNRTLLRFDVQIQCMQVGGDGEGAVDADKRGSGEGDAVQIAGALVVNQPSQCLPHRLSEGTVGCC